MPGCQTITVKPERIGSSKKKKNQCPPPPTWQTAVNDIGRRRRRRRICSCISRGKGEASRGEGSKEKSPAELKAQVDPCLFVIDDL